MFRSPATEYFSEGVASFLLCCVPQMYNCARNAETRFQPLVLCLPSDLQERVVAELHLAYTTIEEGIFLSCFHETKLDDKGRASKLRQHMAKMSTMEKSLKVQMNTLILPQILEKVGSALIK